MACFACSARACTGGRGETTAACINAKPRGADNFLIPVGQQIVASTGRGGRGTGAAAKLSGFAAATPATAAAADKCRL